jgi:polyferredoxin
MMYWCLYLIGVTLPGNIDVITKLESYKYLTGELLMTIFFWIAFIGRGYCYFCPLGTVLGLLSKVSNQKITTNHTKCVQCSKCNVACPMSIDIINCAVNGEDVRSLRCVGCGHCVDACPTNNLCYSTRFISQIHKKQQIRK